MENIFRAVGMSAMGSSKQGLGSMSKVPSDGVASSRTCSRGKGGRGALSSLRRDASGTTAVEFAFISPLLFLLIIGTIELGSLFAANIFLKNATYAMARTGRTGYVATDQSQLQTARAVLSRQAGGLMDPESLVVTSEAYLDFNELGKREPFMDANGNGVRDDGETFTDVNGNGKYDASGVDGMGGTSEVVLYTVTYPWTFITPMVGRYMTPDGEPLMLEATAVVQNEPY